MSLSKNINSAKNKRPKLLLICINYNSDNETEFYLNSIKKSALDIPMEFEIILVDNTENRDSREFFKKVQAINSNVRCISAPKNLGYFGGARLGIESAENIADYYDFVIVSNVDVWVNENFFNQLIQLNLHVSTGIIGPAIYTDHNNKNLNPFISTRPHALKMAFYSFIYKYYWISNLYNHLYILKSALTGFVRAKTSHKRSQHNEEAKNKNNLSETYAPHGSFLILTKKYFEECISLDYPCFLFGEEIFLAEMCLIKRLNVQYTPELVVHTKEHVSTGWSLTTQKNTYLKESADYNLHRFFR